MVELDILLPALLNGIMTGAVYALVALGLTLIYGVLHIINFAHGSLLMLALYGVYFLYTLLGIDPYLAFPIAVPAFFALGYGLQRSVIGYCGRGKDENILLVTLGLSLVIENLALYFWSADTRTISTSYSFATVDLGVAVIAVPRLVAFAGALVVAGFLWLLIHRTDLGKAIRALAKERQGAQLVGINVEHVFAMSFGIGIASLGAAACLLLPSYYANPGIGRSFVLIAFTIVVLGGMGSFAGALVGGLIIGVTESLGGLFLGESLGQLGIFLIFIAILLFRPTGLFGARPLSRP
ncbi:MAG TPA: branched-chain amino acid ABC transporter permease [Alphaproteobacteria bacterium]|nr:branched-chain amino acid ABC transporter permease [Alphaproteobacteria bacterium]